MAKINLYDGSIARIANDAAEKGLRAALGRAETILKADILNRQGTGQFYGKHRASAPGEPPAKDTGALSANTNADANISSNGDSHVGRITANAAQAEALEKGTEKMAARPFLGLLATEYGAELHKAFVEGAKE